ncbi:protein winged eye isoform X2 [Chrysoperla carnea]|uniref:protein winged eye isoform X2 n=1 Tax=Chrysoperla carnea TaxID=189513 RepID=UPI001D06C81C|nr:protein winged eye isoform X2 [Chrysoperla carnea]
MLGSPAATGPGGGGDRAATLWPPTPPASIYPPSHHHPHHQQHHTTVSSGITTSVGATPLAAPACISSGTNNSSTAEAFSRYGLYSVFPGGAAAAAGAFYSHAAAATAGAFGRPPTAATYYAQHKLISETAGCYSFGAPTPPPGSPYSPLPVTHLELLAKSFNNNSIIIQQTPQDFTSATLQQQQLQQQQQNITFNNNNIINSINNNNNNNNNNYNNLKLQKDNNNTIITTDKQQQQQRMLALDEQQPQLKRWMNTCSTLSPLSVKTENNCYSPITTTINSNNNNCNNNNSAKAQQRSVCGCRNNIASPSHKNKLVDGGCSRTNPWTPSSGLQACSDKHQAVVTGSGGGTGLIGPIHVQVKREPATTPACQVAEITTSNNHHTNAIVKVEAPSPTSVTTLSPNITDNNSSSIVQTMSSITTCTTGNGTIPVGIAVARQRLQQELTPTLQPSGGLLTTATGPAQIKEIDSASVAAAAMTVGVTTNGGGSIVQCGDDRTNNMTSWPLPSAHGSTLAAPTLWQYPAPVPMEPMLPVPVPMPPVGFQLVRDPTTGHFFVIPTTSFDQLQQAVVWPSYPQPSSHVLLPPIPPPPLAPLQLLGSTTSDYLATASTTLHQHTQTHSTRLVALTTDNNNKRKPISLPSHTLIKIESDCTPSDQQTTKTLQTLQSTMAATNTGCNATTMFTDQSITPLLTTHVFYQHPTNLIQIAPQASVQPTVEAVCRSQATSPVACLTPPPETSMQEADDSTCLPGVQDASNQTDTPICSEDDNTTPNERDNYYIAPTSDHQPQTPLQQMQDLKIPVIVPPTSTIMTPNTPNTPNNDVKIQISTAITTTQITEMRQCLPITIMSQIEPTKPSTKIVEIVEPESSTKEIDSAPTSCNTSLENDGGEQVVSTTTASNTTYSNVDISGLELLSNSIVELENYRNSFDATPVKIEKDLDEEIKTNETEAEEYQKTPGEDVVVKKIADMSITDKNKGKDSEVCGEEQTDDLGGLGLLCALAEQRIMEEVTEKTIPTQPIKFEKHVDIDCKKKLKRCLEERYSLDSNKKFKVGDFEFERKPQIKTVPEEKLIEKPCDKEIEQTEEKITSDVSESIKPCCNKSDWSKMNELEKDMRLRLAELQRQCNEKQMELKKLAPQIDVMEQNKKTLRKSKSKSLDCDRRSLSPPKLEKQEPIRTETTDLLKPPVLNTIGNHGEISHKRKLSPPELSEVLSDSTTPFEKFSSSKKRKVGRPKKLSTPDLCEATEMIVAKKPKSLVGYLLAAKNRLHSQSKSCSNSSSPPRYNIEDSPSPKPKSKSHKRSKSISKSEKKKKSLNKKRDKHNGSSKVRPKLKAEPKVKLFSDEEENSSSEWSPEDSSRMEEDDDYEDEEEEDKDDTEVDDKNDDFDESSNVSDETNETETKDMRCVLTSEHLEIDKLRVLTSMGGLFYAGVLSAIQAPDIYAITLDGERGNRPHIMSREEILRDAILEVSPATTQELLPGTRLCAYWSQQYRCLYPGTVAEPGTPDPTLDDRFVCVEFDDGDSGRIALEDIRLLQADYPIVEYDPNPLLSLSKRKRRISMNSNVEERRLNVQSTNVLNTDSKTNTEMKIKSDSRNENNMCTKLKPTKKHRKERKKLKKHRRDKLKKLMRNGEEKKRKKKHKCCDEHCKHRRHHKKHRKHRKHHHSNKNRNGDSNMTNNVTIIDETENDLVEYDEQALEENAIQENPSDSYEEENVASEQDDVEQEDNEDNDDDDEEDEVEEEEEEEAEEEEQDNNEDDGDIESDNTVSEKKSKKVRERQESVESRSKMAAFLPARQLWGWSGKGYKRPGAKGRARKQFFKTIQRGKETISVGDAAVFLSTGRPDRPYIGRIEAMWESLRNSMVVKVKWFYHPEETVGCPLNLQYPGALFESPHVDENDVQTISHKCEVLPLKDYTNKLGSDPQRYETIYDNNDIYYRAGYYDPTTTTLKMEPDIPLAAVE